MSFVGIVLVSHSEPLAEGLRSILSQVAPGVPIGVAGGTDDGGVGTSAVKIKEAVESVYAAPGVVILFDLGSALLNTELAMEWLGEGKKVRIADAPFVEGAYAAAVEAGCGSSLDEVLQAAEGAKALQKR